MTATIQTHRTPAGQLLWAGIALGADDLAFVGEGTEWLAVEKKRAQNALYITITESDAP